MTTTRIDALRELLAKVKAGECTTMQPAANAFPPENPYGECTFHLVTRAYNGSLDAAKALHEAVLPDWDWLVRKNGWASVWSHDYEQVTWEAGDRVTTDIVSGSQHRSTVSDNPARAWLIAILKALIAMEAAQ